MRKLPIRHAPDPVMSVLRSGLWSHKMVYLILADRRIKYHNGRRSRVIYIGTTRKGARRPATNAAAKAMNAFEELRGVRKVEVHILKSKSRQHIKTWEELEAALLVVFQFRYGSLPRFNHKIGSIRDADDIQLFRESKWRSLLKSFEQ